MQLKLRQRKVVAFIFLVSTVNMLLGCQRYYMPVSGVPVSGQATPSQLKKLESDNKVFILRQGNKSFLMKNVSVDESKMTMTSFLGAVPAEHQPYIVESNKRSYKKVTGNYLLHEVHIYVPATVQTDTLTSLSLNMGDIQKIEILEKDGPRTTTSYILGGLGITLGTIALLTVIVALTKSSCPYVSAYSGGQYNLQGELFGGAIYPSLQREDFVPINLSETNGDYLIRISNELKERQYADYANLLIVDHDSNVRVLADPEGKLHTVSMPVAPVAAILNQHKDVSDDISKEDMKSCLFDDMNTTGSSGDLYLTFNNSNNSKHGKIVLNLKNSYWFDYLYGEFTKGFGGYYSKWIKQQKRVPAGELQKWSQEQNIPLTVYVKTNSGWKEITKLKTIGPLLNRQVVIPMDIETTGAVEIKLSTGFMFWELDYAGLDLSPDAPLLTQEIKPYEATNDKGLDVLSGLLNADKKFLNQPNTGDVAYLKYKSPEQKAGSKRTILLHTSGYYEHVRSYSGTPKIAFLKGFKNPGTFNAFSKQKFLEIKNQLTVAAK